MNKLPSDYKSFPMASVEQSHEREQAAYNIMQILARNGNTWRKLSLKEYKKERKKDGQVVEHLEEHFFLCCRWHCLSAETADSFCPTWYSRSKQEKLSK
jgi:hypothetical protein